MRPTLTALYSTYGTLLDAILGSYFSLQSTIFTYCGNLRLFKLCCSAALATICSSVANFVCMIVNGSIPSKISKTVILTVSVIMTAFLSEWPRTHKSRQNKCVHPNHLGLVISPKQHKWPWIGLEAGGLFQTFGFNRPYPAKVRNLIYSFVSKDWLPVFHNHECGI